MQKLKIFLSTMRSTFWLLPSLIVFGCIVFAIVLIEVDSVSSDLWLAQWPRLFGAGPEGARQMLSTLAGSMMSVMGITFSMTLVALALASSQYTSRILWNFMRSQVTQITLGGFAGIFAYCLIVLRTIRGGEMEFVPNLAVFFAFVMALVSIGVLVFFIHHIASSIQASSIIASIAHETTTSIDRLFSEKQAGEPDKSAESSEVLQAQDERSWYAVSANLSGYIQRVDFDALLNLARERRTIVCMEHAVGAFVVENTVLASIALTYPPDHETVTALNKAYSIGRHRTVEQDPAFGIRQLVDMALKALSPGVNDTSTAVMCVDYLAAILARLVCLEFPPSHRYEEEKLRVIGIVPTFEDLLDEAFDQIRASAAGNVAIMARMLGAINTIGTLTVSPHYRKALDEHVQRIAELAESSIKSNHDRTRIDRRIMNVREPLESGSQY